MKLSDVTQEFKDWMLSQGAWEKYVDNFDESFSELDYTREVDFITYAFLWKETEQGFDYWDNLNRRWGEYLYTKRDNPDLPIHFIQDTLQAKEEMDNGEVSEYTGGSSSYYKTYVANPTTQDTPYTAECNDIIEALDMNFAEGNILKAVWRKAAARQGKKKKGYTSGLYDVEKINFFVKRLLVQEQDNGNT